MAYLDVISLAQAKIELRVDDALTDDDTSITRMIETALRFVENYTNYYVTATDKSYPISASGEGCFRLYDYPVNSTQVVDSDLNPISSVEYDHKGLYTVITPGAFPATVLVNVGFTDPANVPPGLIDVALEILGLLYYGPETGKTVQKDLSPMSWATLNQYKRFLI